VLRRGGCVYQYAAFRFLALCGTINVFLKIKRILDMGFGEKV
jgi:hypothetical protein